VHNAHSQSPGPALSATGDIPTPWECQPQGVIGHNSLPFSLLFSSVQQYFKKQKLFIFVKTSPLVSPVYLEGTLWSVKSFQTFRKQEVALLQAFHFCKARHHFLNFKK